MHGVAEFFWIIPFFLWQKKDGISDVATPSRDRSGTHVDTATAWKWLGKPSRETSTAHPPVAFEHVPRSELEDPRFLVGKTWLKNDVYHL